jgi:3-oxoacyl-[acyl-carrier protein] reductase
LISTSSPIALVTGASGGIGRAIACRLARDGFHVLAHGHRNRAAAEATVQAIVEGRGSGETIFFDVTDRAAVESALDGRFPPSEKNTPAVLVNNAGFHRDNLAGLMSDEEFDGVVRANLYGTFYLLRWCTRRMIRKREGAIVNVASLAGQTGNPGQINYAASKAGVIAMTKTLAQELGARNIRVNAVAPGFVETEMLSGVPGLDAMKERIPLRRFGTAEEVASAVAFLCSKDAAYVTGHTLSVNGGLFPA